VFDWNIYLVWKVNFPPSCHEGMWDSEDLSPRIPKLNFPRLSFIHSPFFNWICSRMSPRIKQDASQIHIEHRKDEVWEPWSTLNRRLCPKPIPNMWQCDSLLIPNFECDSVLTLRSIRPPTSWFCNSTHSTWSAKTQK